MGKGISPQIKMFLGCSPNTPDKTIKKMFFRTRTQVCKPCWELKYCPYGPLVEQFPLPPQLRADAIDHHNYLVKCLKGNKLGNGSRIDPKRRRQFTKEVREFDPNEYPEEIPTDLQEMACTVFGHVCPVYYVGEPFTETKSGRKFGRSIPFKTKVRVVRRDNYTCQHCGKHLVDNEVEFDHVIPVSKGGSSEEHNLRLTCFKCNRNKSDRVSI